jgi:hypothetical protein
MGGHADRVARRLKEVSEQRNELWRVFHHDNL